MTVCPVCQGSSQRKLRAYRLPRRTPPAGSTPTAESVARAYAFSLFANGKDYVDASSLVCKNCGLVFLQPRPTVSQLAEKYALISPYLETRYDPVLTDNERRRSRDLKDYVSQDMALDVGSRILDVGGANGRIMAAFVDAGYECGVVDPGVKQAIDGARWLGPSLDSLPADARFDLVISAHTLEHLIDPVAELASMVSRLAPGGVLYFEVPQGCYREVWHTRFIDLIGHVNYFSQGAMACLLARAGFGVNRLQLKVRRYADFFLPCIVGTATVGGRHYPHGWGYRRTLMEMYNPLHYSRHVLAKLLTVRQHHRAT